MYSPSGQSEPFNKVSGNLRFRVTTDLDIIVLKVIQITAAHITDFGKDTELFEKALGNFIAQEVVKSKMNASSSRPT